MLLYVYIKRYQKVSSCVNVCSHPMIKEGFKLCYCMFTSNDMRKFQALFVLQAQCGSRAIKNLSLGFIATEDD